MNEKDRINESKITLERKFRNKKKTILKTNKEKNQIKKLK